MNRLLLLNNTLVESAERSTIRSAFPIAARPAPVRAIAAWKQHEGELHKTFKFADIDERNSFLYQLLAYEQEKGHHGVLTVDEKNISIVVSTRDLRKLTELDREYSRAVDQIYNEVKDATARRTSSLDE